VPAGLGEAAVMVVFGQGALAVTIAPSVIVPIALIFCI
jgi:hypothetical protein